MAKRSAQLVIGATTTSIFPAALLALSMHGVVLAGLQWLPIDSFSAADEQSPQLQVRKGEQVFSIQLRADGTVDEVADQLKTATRLMPPVPLVNKPATETFSTPVDLPQSDQALAPRRTSGTGVIDGVAKLPVPSTSTIGPIDSTSSLIQSRPMNASDASGVTSPATALPQQSVRLEITEPVAVTLPPVTVSQQAPSKVAPVGVTAGIAIQSLAAPEYPAMSRRRGEQGTVILEVEVLRDGSTGAIRILRSPNFRRLEEAAIEAARRGQFKPATKAGKPIDSHIRIPFEFVLTT